jgi:hypothetical protein
MRESEFLETQDIRSFFSESLVNQIGRRNMEVRDDTVAYLTNLLTTFVRSDQFYEWTPQGPTLTPLALMYGEVVNTPSSIQKQKMLQRLGDVALFIAGLFAESFQRKCYDVDYYIGMGGAAYGTLSESMECQTTGRMHSQIFAELSCSFADFVQVLGEIVDSADPQDDKDVFKLYQMWMRTGSERAARKLERAGVNVIDPGNSTRH